MAASNEGIAVDCRQVAGRVFGSEPPEADHTITHTRRRLWLFAIDAKLAPVPLADPEAKIAEDVLKGRTGQVLLRPEGVGQHLKHVRQRWYFDSPA